LRRHLLLAKSADQWLQAGLAETDPARARVWFDEALAHAARCRAAMPLRTALEASAITQAMADRGLAPWSDVVDAGERVLVHDPRHTMTMVRIAEALARTGEAERAAEWARRALEADASFALDPLRRLAPSWPSTKDGSSLRSSSHTSAELSRRVKPWHRSSSPVPLAP